MVTGNNKAEMRKANRTGNFEVCNNNESENNIGIILCKFNKISLLNHKGTQSTSQSRTKGFPL
jgi:hypothetical protein